MSLATRLERLQRHQDGSTTLENFRWLTTEEMGKDVINFGKAHQGETLHHVWTNHQDWIKYMVKRFANSTKVEHQKLFIYVDRMIKKEEIHLGVVSDPDDEETMPVAAGKGAGKSSHQGKSAAAKPKAKAKMAAHPAIPTGEEEWELATEVENTSHALAEENVQASKPAC